MANTRAIASLHHLSLSKFCMERQAEKSLDKDECPQIYLFLQTFKQLRETQLSRLLCFFLVHEPVGL